ncbi:MAG: PorT family protein [Paludibacteraceae bacterium]|nr:PorT family protein [Paludibacteraceae bacterium]
MNRAWLVLVACCLCLPVAAQYKFIEPELAIGTNQGVALWPHISFSPSVSQNFDVRYTGGLNVRYIIQKHFGLQVEFNYSQRGWSTTNDAGETYSHRLDYLELPLVSHIYFGKTNRFFINLGPKLKYMIYDKADTPLSDGGVEQFKAIENRFDYGIFAGLGYELHSGKAGSFQLEARYDCGLANIFSDRKGEDFSRSGNQAITVTFVYMFNVLQKTKD